MSGVPEINRHIACKATEALAIIASILGRDDLAEPLCCGWDGDLGQVAADALVKIVEQHVAAKRTAEDERRDVMAFLRERNAISQGQQVDAATIWAIGLGHHLGAADREAVKP